MKSRKTRRRMGPEAGCHHPRTVWSVKIRAGQPIDEEMQERLDELCK